MTSPALPPLPRRQPVPLYQPRMAAPSAFPHRRKRRRLPQTDLKGDVLIALFFFVITAVLVSHVGR